MKEQECKHGEDDEESRDPELHKSMLLLLARAYNYKLKTEDVLELTDGDRQLALETVVGVLEEGETYSTELRQRQKPSTGKVAQWEHELVCHRYEKPLILQLCRLVRGFTHPTTYFSGNSEELELYSVDKFSAEMDGLLNITLKSRIIEKLSIALYDCLFADLEEEEEEAKDANYKILLDETDHNAIVSIHTFMQNLYFYATQNTEKYRQHMLADTLLVPRLILPYLDRCIYHTNLLNRRAETYNRALSMGEDKDDGPLPDPEDIEAVSNLALDHPALVQGIAASLRTLVISSFRAPPTRFVLGLLRRLNPTASMLRAHRFCARHDYIFSLLCLLNVNMGALDLSRSFMQENSVVEAYYAHTLLHEMASVQQKMTPEQQQKVLNRVVFSRALPVARDTPSYAAVMALISGGSEEEIDDLIDSSPSKNDDEEDENLQNARTLAKREAKERLDELKKQVAPELQSEEKSEGNAFRLLGALPSFDRNAADKDDATLIGMSLELPVETKRLFGSEERGAKASAPALMHSSADPNVPKELTCAINGHLMKDPVRSPYGHAFERSTIELWLKMQGSVCPITQQALTAEDLVSDEDLQMRIMRWHIQKTSGSQPVVFSSNDDDDIYDF